MCAVQANIYLKIEIVIFPQAELGKEMYTLQKTQYFLHFPNLFSLFLTFNNSVACSTFLFKHYFFVCNYNYFGNFMKERKLLDINRVDYWLKILPFLKMN